MNSKRKIKFMALALGQRQGKEREQIRVLEIINRFEKNTTGLCLLCLDELRQKIKQEKAKEREKK